MKQWGPIVPLALATLILLATAAAAGAQLRPGMGGGDNTPASQFRIYALGGWTEVDVDEMNARLAALPEPYTPVDDDMLTLGGGLHARMNRLLAGIEGALMVSFEEGEVADARRAAFSGFYGAAMVGFSILQTDGLDVYPLVQVGAAGATLEVQERGDPSWDDILGDPGRSSTLSTFTVYSAGGLGIEYAFPGGFFAGVRGTWAYTPTSDGWSAEHGDVLGGPEVSLSGPSLRLMIGFGGRGGRR